MTSNEVGRRKDKKVNNHLEVVVVNLKITVVTTSAKCDAIDSRGEDSNAASRRAAERLLILSSSAHKAPPPIHHAYAPLCLDFLSVSVVMN
ncbi:hypothetical protein POUND7_017857 [Theobroma cacao]